MTPSSSPTRRRADGKRTARPQLSGRAGELGSAAAAARAKAGEHEAASWRQSQPHERASGADGEHDGKHHRMPIQGNIVSFGGILWGRTILMVFYENRHLSMLHNQFFLSISFFLDLDSRR